MYTHFGNMEKKIKKHEDIVFNSLDVKEKIEIGHLQIKSTRLAKFGSWVVDIMGQTVY